MVEENSFEQQNSNLAEIPKLPRCIVLDSRFSSQQRLKFDLGKSALFKEITIASAMDEGLSVVKKGGADVCVIGPSVSLHAATRFLVTARQIPKRSCALVAFSHKPGSEMALKMSGADEVLEEQSSTDRLSKALVKAVVRIKPNSMWAKYVELFEDKQESQPQKSHADQAQSVVSVLEIAAPSLRRIATGVVEGFYGRGEDGYLTPLTRSALLRVVEAALKNHNPSAEMRELLQTSFEKWVEDILDFGESLAKIRLKNRLLKEAAKQA